MDLPIDQYTQETGGDSTLHCHITTPPNTPRESFDNKHVSKHQNTCETPVVSNLQETPRWNSVSVEDFNHVVRKRTYQIMQSTDDLSLLDNQRSVALKFEKSNTH